MRWKKTLRKIWSKKMDTICDVKTYKQDIILLTEICFICLIIAD